MARLANISMQHDDAQDINAGDIEGENSSQDTEYDDAEIQRQLFGNTVAVTENNSGEAAMEDDPVDSDDEVDITALDMLNTAVTATRTTRAGSRQPSTAIATTTSTTAKTAEAASPVTPKKRKTANDVVVKGQGVLRASPRRPSTHAERPRVPGQVVKKLKLRRAESSLLREHAAGSSSGPVAAKQADPYDIQVSPEKKDDATVAQEEAGAEKGKKRKAKAQPAARSKRSRAAENVPIDAVRAPSPAPLPAPRNSGSRKGMESAASVAQEPAPGRQTRSRVTEPLIEPVNYGKKPEAVPSRAAVDRGEPRSLEAEAEVEIPESEDERHIVAKPGPAKSRPERKRRGKATDTEEQPEPEYFADVALPALMRKRGKRWPTKRDAKTATPQPAPPTTSPPARNSSRKAAPVAEIPETQYVVPESLVSPEAVNVAVSISRRLSRPSRATAAQTSPAPAKPTPRRGVGLSERIVEETQEQEKAEEALLNDEDEADVDSDVSEYSDAEENPAFRGFDDDDGEQDLVSDEEPKENEEGDDAAEGEEVDNTILATDADGSQYRRRRRRGEESDQEPEEEEDEDEELELNRVGREGSVILGDDEGISDILLNPSPQKPVPVRTARQISQELSEPRQGNVAPAQINGTSTANPPDVNGQPSLAEDHLGAAAGADQAGDYEDADDYVTSALVEKKKEVCREFEANAKLEPMVKLMKQVGKLRPRRRRRGEGDHTNIDEDGADISGEDAIEPRYRLLARTTLTKRIKQIIDLSEKGYMALEQLQRAPGSDEQALDKASTDLKRYIGKMDGYLTRLAEEISSRPEEDAGGGRRVLSTNDLTLRLRDIHYWLIPRLVDVLAAAASCHTSTAILDIPQLKEMVQLCRHIEGIYQVCQHPRYKSLRTGITFSTGQLWAPYKSLMPLLVTFHKLCRISIKDLETFSKRASEKRRDAYVHNEEHERALEWEEMRRRNDEEAARRFREENWWLAYKGEIRLPNPALPDTHPINSQRALLLPPLVRREEEMRRLSQLPPSSSEPPQTSDDPFERPLLDDEDAADEEEEEQELDEEERAEQERLLLAEQNRRLQEALAEQARNAKLGLEIFNRNRRSLGLAPVTLDSREAPVRDYDPNYPSTHPINNQRPVVLTQEDYNAREEVDDELDDEDEEEDGEARDERVRMFPQGNVHAPVERKWGGEEYKELAKRLMDNSGPGLYSDFADEYDRSLDEVFKKAMEIKQLVIDEVETGRRKKLPRWAKRIGEHEQDVY